MTVPIPTFCLQGIGAWEGVEQQSGVFYFGESNSTTSGAGMTLISRRTVVALVALLGALAALSGSGCASSASSRGGRTSGSTQDWASGPIRWLLLPQESRAFRRLNGTPRALAFIEGFWRKRDPEPHLPENRFAETFFERVAAADRIYPEGETRGSLTDRGRVLVLLGSPDLLRYTSKEVPTLRRSETTGHFGSGTQTARVEVWGYRWEALNRELRARVDVPAEGDFITLSFVDEGHRIRLISGDDVLDHAARAAILR